MWDDICSAHPVCNLGMISYHNDGCCGRQHRHLGWDCVEHGRPQSGCSLLTRPLEEPCQEGGILLVGCWPGDPHWTLHALLCFQLAPLRTGARTASTRATATTGPSAAPTTGNANALQAGRGSTARRVSGTPSEAHQKSGGGHSWGRGPALHVEELSSPGFLALEGFFTQWPPDVWIPLGG